MQRTKKQIISLLRNNGGLTAVELSETLGISTTAVRRHLNNLEARDLIQHRIEQRGLGRPSFIFHLANGVPGDFKESFVTFARSVMQEVSASENGQSPEELYQRRQKQRRQQYVKLTQGESLGERVASLAQLMESEGRLTTWQQRDPQHFILREHNCPFGQLDTAFDAPCRCELALLQQTLHADVEQVSDIRQGDVACVFEIRDTRVDEFTRVEELTHVFFEGVKSKTAVAA